MLAWEYSFVQRLFALCNISTRLTKKGMRANDTQFLLFPLNIRIWLVFLFLPMFFFFTSQIVVRADLSFFVYLFYNQIYADFRIRRFHTTAKQDCSILQATFIECRVMVQIQQVTSSSECFL